MTANVNDKETPADIETASEDYARRFAGPVGAWMLDVQRRTIRGCMPDSPGASVLDVGGGHAQTAIPLAKAGYQVTVHGSDESCKARLHEELDAKRIQFVVSSMSALPFPDRSFDYVVCIRLLPHCSRWPDLIKELCRVARHTVIVDYPARRSVNLFAELLFSVKKRVEGNTRPFRLFHHREVAQPFIEAGFGEMKRKNQYFFPMALHRALNRVWLSKSIEAPCRALGLTHLLGSPTVLKAVRSSGVGP